MNNPSSVGEAVRWAGYPSWRQFVWLYFFSLMTGLRAVLFYRFDIPGWQMWLIGTMALLACVPILRLWARYIITPTRLIVRNGYTGRDIQTMPFDQVGEVDAVQGPIARWTGIGTIQARHVTRDEVLRFRGIADPEVVRRRIVALKPALESPRTAP